MAAIALALGASLAWGASDFVAGLKSRQLAVIWVLLVSQATGLALSFVAAVGAGEPLPSLHAVAWGTAAGLAELVGFAAFYRALAIGTMSIVAPISSTGAALPVIVGIATGDRPSAVQVVGIVAAVAGVVLASRELEDDRPTAAVSARASIGLALVAALGFGTFFIGMKSGADASVPWALRAARAASVAAVLGAVAALRVPLPRAPRRLGPIVLVGLLDAGANGLYAAAATEGLLSVVAVLGALYPVSTVLLARVVLGERVRRLQEAGIVAALAGVALIAAG